MASLQSFPTYRGEMEYVCLGCQARYPIDQLHYTCPSCKSVFLLENTRFGELAETSGGEWRDIFDQRAATKNSALRGIFRFYELMAPVMSEEDVVYLGEGNTPITRSSKQLEALVGQSMAFKNDGQNPSASFKDRGMACAFSYLKHLTLKYEWDQVLTICASTGDTSAAAALYAAYVGEPLTSVVLLPQGKVTAQQLSQPLGSGARVLELPGVFDDCMKVVEYLADHYRVALLNSKNAWRILGQESYAFEVAQWYDWDMRAKVVFVPIGNAGNITAIMSGFLKLFRLGIIETLPKIIGVQSEHADPVYRYYTQEQATRRFEAIKVRPSVAQAAMIGNPVSFPRVAHLASEYELLGGCGSFQVVHVSEQRIIESMLLANRHGHIACTQGGECLAGLLEAKELGMLERDELAILDATAHALKFSGFQDMYFQQSFGPEYGIVPDPKQANIPQLVITPEEKETLSELDYTEAAATNVVSILGLNKKD